MTFSPQHLAIKLLGLATKDDPKHSAIGKLALVENAYATRRAGDNGVELRKRYGGTDLGRNIVGGGSISEGRQVAARGLDLVQQDPRLLYSYNGTTADTWTKRGKMQNIAATIERVSGDTLVDGSDIAYAGGFSVMVTHQGSGTTNTSYFVFDEATGQKVASGTFQGQQPRIVAVGSAVFIFYYRAANTIHCRTISASTPTTLGAETDVATDVEGTLSVRRWDVTVDSANSRMLVGYTMNTGTDTKWKVWTTGMSAGSSGTTARNGRAAIGWMTHEYGDGFAYLGCATTTGAVGVRLLKINMTTLALDTDTAIDTGVTTCGNITGYTQDATHRAVFYAIPGATRLLDRIAGWYETSTFTVARAAALRSKVFKVGSSTAHYYFLVMFEGGVHVGWGSQKNLLLLEYEHAAFGGNGGINIAGYFFTGKAGGITHDPGVLGWAAQVSATKVLLSYGAEDSESVDATRLGLKIGLDFAGTGLGSPVEYADAVYFPGAACKIFDGAGVGENGYYILPEPPTAVSQAGAGMVLGGTYEWCTVIARRYRSGRVVRSAPSQVVQLTLTAGQGQAALTIPTHRLTDYATRYNIDTNVVAVTIELYRTKNGEKNMYRVTGSITNDVTADTVAYTDTMSDSTLDDNLELYTKGGVVDHVFPPAVLMMTVFQGRLVAACGDGTLWFSKQLEEGKGAEFSDALRIPFDASKGQFTGLSATDTALVVQQRSATYVITGAGPDNTGNGLYDLPTEQMAPAGAVAAKAVGRIPEGILYQSVKGFRVFTRGFDDQPVEGIDSYASLSVTGAVALDDRPLVVFPTSSGTSLVWDWQFKTWYTWTGQVAVGACLWNRQLCLLGSDGKVRREIAAQYNDNGSAIAMKATLTYIALAGLLGRFKLWSLQVLAEIMASFTLSVSTQYDDDATTLETTTLAVTTSTKMPVQVDPAIQEGRAVQITIQESSTTEGFRLSGFDAYFGVDGKPGKVPAAQVMSP